MITTDIVDGSTMYREDDFLEDVVRIAKQRGHRIETVRNQGLIPQIDFGHKKLHAGHIRQLYPKALREGSDINKLIEAVASGRPCARRPFRQIVDQIRSERRDLLARAGLL